MPQRMAQRFPSGLDNADEFQVIVQRGASRDLLDLALFICIESHLGKGMEWRWRRWPLIGEMMEWMVANHIQPSGCFILIFDDPLMISWWILDVMISYYSHWDLQDSPWWFFAIFWWHKIMVEQEDRGYAMRPLRPFLLMLLPCAYSKHSKHPNHPNHPNSIQSLSLSFLEIVWQRQSQSMPYSILIAVWLYARPLHNLHVHLHVHDGHGWFQQKSLDSQLKPP